MFWLQKYFIWENVCSEIGLKMKKREIGIEKKKKLC